MTTEASEPVPLTDPLAGGQAEADRPGHASRENRLIWSLGPNRCFAGRTLMGQSGALR